MSSKTSAAAMTHSMARAGQSACCQVAPADTAAAVTRSEDCGRGLALSTRSSLDIIVRITSAMSSAVSPSTASRRFATAAQSSAGDGQAGSITRVVHKGGRGGLEVVHQRRDVVSFGVARIHGLAHVGQPRLALRGANTEPNVPHTQPGVASLFAVRARSAPVLCQEERQVALWRSEIFWIERP